MLAKVGDIVGRAFDYVIVGGGTAGLVVASRLSEDPSVTVLVLEAGQANFNDETINMSGTFGKNFFHPEKDWKFMTVPQKYSDGTEFYWPRGKGLGGSSALNFYVFTQPPADDIDAIEKLGNPRWNWARHLQYSKKSETFYPPDADVAKSERLHFDANHHGSDGPIATRYPPVRSGWDNLYQDTLGNLGLKPVKDAVGGDGNGAWMATCSVNPETNNRSYATAYLTQAENRKNLAVVVGAPVSKVISKSENSSGYFVASGVEFIHEGQIHQVFAGKEVILSAGALKSPQILELSGIGNPDILSPLGIPTKVNLPSVGENVQEHLFAALSFELKHPEGYNTLDPVVDPEVLKEQLKHYSEHKGLFLLSFLGVGTVSLDRLSANGASLRATHIDKVKALRGQLSPSLQGQYDIQLEKLENSIAGLEVVSVPTFLSKPNPPEPGKKYMTFVSIMNHPWSRGTIHTTSVDPQAPPAMDPHYFEDDFDLQNLVELVKFVRKFAQTAPLSEIIAREHNPGPEVETEKQLVSWIKKWSNSIAHTSGTCSMLPKDKGGVVDHNLKVYGTDNLRVVDLSILPLQIGAPTQTYVYAMAEQAADIIKGLI